MNAKAVLFGFTCGVIFTFAFMVQSTFKYNDVVPLINRLRKSVNIKVPSKQNLSFSINSVVELARNKTSEAKNSFAKITSASYSPLNINDVVEFARKKSSEAVASFAKVTKEFYKIQNISIRNEPCLYTNMIFAKMQHALSLALISALGQIV